MSDLQNQPASTPDPPIGSAPSGFPALPPELETLPAELKSSMFSLMWLFVRNTTGPDPETSRVVAQSEMHEESCRLEGYKESLKTRDKQNQRDHEFRKQQLSQQMVLSLVVAVTCVGGIACGLYLLIVRKEETLGSGLMIASFMALLNGKSVFKKDDD